MPASESAQSETANSRGTRKSVTRLVHAREFATATAAALPLIGALGTAVFWMVTTYYLGTIEIKPNCEFQSISIRVFDLKGAEREFHSLRFQLVPGDYDLAVAIDNKPVHRYRATVKFNCATSLPVSAGNNTDVASEPQELPAVKKKWWQFWKR